jgi:preprotein translocase subunit YajC
MPMQRQRKQTQKMLAGLQNGNTVVTSGGIVGTIIAIESDDTLVLRVKPDGVKLQVSRASVSSMVSPDGKK